jgi:hypothetical protein
LRETLQLLSGLYSQSRLIARARITFHIWNTALQNESHTYFARIFSLADLKLFEDGQPLTMPDDSPAATGNANADIWELIQALVLGRVPADRILELFYWGQQPGVLEMVRAILDMRPESRAALAAFLTVAQSKSISTEVERSGRLILSSPEITEAAAILREIEKAALNPDAREPQKQARNF